MLNSIRIRNDKKKFSRTRSVGACAALLSLACFGASEAMAQCTLGGTVSNWTAAGSGNWSTSADWSAGVPNSATTSACITNGTVGTPTAVNLDVNATVDNLQLGSFDTLSTALNTQLGVAGTQIVNDGSIALNGGGGSNTFLFIENNVTLSGGGTLTLSTAGGGGNTYLEQSGGSFTLTNQSTIQGNGIIGNNGLSLSNSGTVEANVSGQVLEFAGMTSGLANSGLLEAANSGVLQINGVTVNNAGGNITANAGSSVQLFGSATIQGGTLTNNGSFLGTPAGNVAYLDGSTGAGAITLNGTYTSDTNSDTYLLGTLNNKGNFQLNGGGGSNAIVLLDSSTVTLQGGGTVTMAVNGGGGSAYLQQAVGGVTLTNVDNTIQGAGVMGNGGLTLVNQATINANSSGQTLLLNPSGGVTNTGVMEASGGGILQISGITVNNAGGNITANAGSSVQLFGSAVIQGGTLTNNGSFLGTPAGNVAYLDGSTVAGAITLNGTYTSDANSDTYLLGTINNKGNFQLNGGSGSNAVVLLDSPNVTLQGGGTVTMAVNGGGGSAYLEQAVGGVTLTNVDNTIQGAGVMGNGGLTLVNQATINANSSGQALLLNPSGGVTNTGVMEASGGGILQISGITVNNAGGNITANAGSSVQLFGSAVIQGGTLTNNGGFLGTPAGNVAYLDGSTGAGAITLNGTYTSDTNSDTYLLGTLNNKGNFQLNGGSGSNAIVLLDSSTVTLQGGGTVTMAVNGGGGSAYLEQAVGGVTLTNVDNTIQGAGVMGNGGLTLVNQATINANSSGQTLLLNPSGGVTNTGVMEASGGGILQISGITVNNAGGNITANAGSSVQLFGSAVIQGGTLTNNGSFLGTPAGNVAYLDGSTVAGAITVNGTYTSDTGSETFLRGTLNNTGNFQLNGGSGSNAFVLLDSGNVTLQGGGTVTMAVNGGGGSAYLEQTVGGLTLTNVDNTIQGAGVIGNGGLTVINGTAGKILANAPGQTFQINGSGGVTNNGTMQVNAGSTLQVATSFTQSAPGALLNVNGILSFTTPATIGGGTLAGTGTVTVGGAGTLTSSGHVAPGTYGGAPGALALTGNYVQTSSGFFDVGLAGTSNSVFNVSGTAQLAGTVDVNCVGACNYAALTAGKPTEIGILTSTGLSGDFTTVVESGFSSTTSFTLLQSGGNEYLVVGADGASPAAVPLPPAAWLLVSGLGGMGMLMRRRRGEFALAA